MAIQAQLYSDNFGLPLCGGSSEWIDNGFGGFNPFSFNFQPQKQQQFQERERMLQCLQHQQQRNQTLFFDSGSTLRNTNSTIVVNNVEIVGCFEKQKQEIDCYIRSQNERLRLLLQEQRKQQVGIMMKKIESKASALLRQKDEEIARAVNKTMELENLLKKLEMENQAWQRVAQENKAMVLSLNSTLEQLRENASHCYNNVAEDAESCCEDNREEVKTEEEGQGRRNTTPTTTMVCKCCNSRSSCVLLLPCRHLCSCKDCEALLDSCPVCKTGKKASIEALIFRGEELSGKIEGNSQNRKRKSDDLDYGAWDELQQNLCVW
ncbi:hypothetical protein SLE2022_199670 [Rubroshorea leprosula]